MKTLYFKRWALATLILIFMLIAVGSIVRSTGAGLGCPDWPKCFGMWIPPTDVSQLPSNYQEIYKVAGKTIAPFNVIKTWTEYLNRLFGVVIGLFILVQMILSFAYKKSNKNITRWSIAMFFIVGFQGWIGSLVVSSHLASYMISIHMLLAIFVTCLQAYLVIEAYGLRKHHKQELCKPINFLFGISIAQLILGVQSREKIDYFLKNSFTNRHEWFEQMGTVFNYHRSLAVLLVAVTFLIFFKYKHIIKRITVYRNLSQFIVVVLGLNYVSGVSFKWFDFPAWNQPVHLVLASLIITSLFSFSLIAKPKN